MKMPERIIISRTDSIGDVVLTLPTVGLIKQSLKSSHIIFLGADYTKAVIEACEYVDQFMNWSDLSKLTEDEQVKEIRKLKADAILHIFPRKEIAILTKKSGIPWRIGTTGRLYHWNTCNKLVPISRKRSLLHEAQLNLKIAVPLIGRQSLSLQEIGKLYGLKRIPLLEEGLKGQLSPVKFNIILHPRSKGSAREWGIDRFLELADLLPEEDYKIFVTGTHDEGVSLRKEGFFDHTRSMTDLTGKFSLEQLMAFIASADGLVAASTGPLHIAAALGKIAIGIYPPIKPMHPGRWAPVGENAASLVMHKECRECRKDTYCKCIRMIQASEVRDKLSLLIAQKGINNSR